MVRALPACLEAGLETVEEELDAELETLIAVGDDRVGHGGDDREAVGWEPAEVVPDRAQVLRHLEAVLCTDAIQFPDEPAVAYEEIRRVLKPGGRVALTCWEPFDRADERLSPRLRRVNLAAGLRQAGFTDVEVRDRPSWLAREHALWEEAAARDPGDDPALRSLDEEAVRSLQWTGLLRRVLAVATNPYETA